MQLKGSSWNIRVPFRDSFPSFRRTMRWAAYEIAFIALQPFGVCIKPTGNATIKCSPVKCPLYITLCDQTHWWRPWQIVRVGSVDSKMHARHPGMLGQTSASCGTVQATAVKRTRSALQIPSAHWRGDLLGRSVQSSADWRCIHLYNFPGANDHVWASDNLHSS